MSPLSRCEVRVSEQVCLARTRVAALSPQESASPGGFHSSSSGSPHERFYAHPGAMRHLPTHLLLAGALTLAPAGLSLASTTAPAHPSAPPPNWRLPLGKSELIRPFTPPSRRYGRGHRGVDLAAAIGAAVCAPSEATITFAGQVNKVPTVVLAHGGGYRSTYQAVTTSLKVGAKVAAGEIFGKVSAPGHLAGPICLHWGLLWGENYLDPLSLLPHLRTHLLPT